MISIASDNIVTIIINDKGEVTLQSRNDVECQDFEFTYYSFSFLVYKTALRMLEGQSTKDWPANKLENSDGKFLNLSVKEAISEGYRVFHIADESDLKMLYDHVKKESPQ